MTNVRIGSWLLPSSHRQLSWFTTFFQLLFQFSGVKQMYLTKVS
jgi:hypothetical protein